MSANKIRRILKVEFVKLSLPFLLVWHLINTEAAAQNFWEQTNGPYGAYVYVLVINSSGHIFAGTDGGRVYRSTNNGDSWTVVNTSMPGYSIHALAINSNGHIFAGTGGGIYHSTNNGDSWTAVNSGLLGNHIYALVINSSGHIFAGTYYAGIYRSTSNGDSWTPINGGLTSTTVYSLVINSSGHIFAGTNAGVYRSTNNGDSWTPINGGLTSTTVHALAINSSEHIFAGTDAGGVYRSTNNGDSWTVVNTSMPGYSINALAINSDGHIFAGTGGGVYRSTSNGDSWTAVNTDLLSSSANALAINSSGHIFAGTNAGVYRSTNNGDSWTPINGGLTSTTVYALAINSSEHIFVGTNTGVYRSTNNDDSWTPINGGLTSTTVYALTINSSGHIFAGTNAGVYRSTNNGDSWAAVGLTLGFVHALAINSDGHIFAGTSIDGVFRSTNNGDSWTAVGLTAQFVNVLAINSRSHIFAGTLGGVYRSINNGDSWAKFNAGLTNMGILSFASKAGFVFAGTSGGVFRFKSNRPPDVFLSPQYLQQQGKKVEILVQVIAYESAANVSLEYRQSGRPQFISVLFLPKFDSLAVTIPADSVTSRGIEYFITAEDQEGRITRVPSSGVFSLQVSVPAWGIRKESTQPYGSEQNAYRLISMPLDLDDKSAKAVLANLGPYNKKKWRLFALRPIRPDGQPYVEYSDTLKMDPGRAFLLIVKDPGKFIDPGAGKSNRTDRLFSIVLQPDWNFVGNPFNFSIPLKNFSLKSGKVFALRYHEGTWRDPILRKRTTIEPFEGYAIFNTSDVTDTLLINPDVTASLGGLVKEFAATIEEKMQWSIRILAQCQEALDEDNVVAIVPGASSNWDELDQPEPPVIGEYVSVYFPHPEWGTLAKNYCTDFRPMTSHDGLRTSEAEIWPFEVKTNIPDKVNLTFEGVDEIPKEFEVWLVDDVLQITQNLREQWQYAVAGAGADHPKQLKLVVGKSDFVNEKLAHAQTIPTTYELSQNFPNPFNPATTIRYGLPKAERVTLKVYNLLGAEVATLVDDEQKAAGYHAAIWDGRDKNGRVVASGVYVYRMQAGRFVMTKKLVLVR